MTKIAINGVGRIGRTLIRAYYKSLKSGDHNDLEIVAINNPGDPASYVHMIKYDSVHGNLPEKIWYEDGYVHIEDTKIRFHHIRDPKEIPWSDDNVDIVIDSTGIFKDKEGLGQHMRGTVKKVIMCAPGKDLDATFVYGVNHEEYDADNHHIISNASCTTNCLAPVAKLLDDAFGIENGLMTTVHAYTNDQNILDNSHKDLRRARAAAMNMIPTSTGAAKTVGVVLPHLKGKLDGLAIRVPTPDVSVIDLVVNFKKATSIEAINNLMKEASEGQMKDILAYNEELTVSQDFLGWTESSIFDSTLTNMISDKCAKIVTWYDNEVGFSHRVLDLASYVGSKL